MHTGALSNQTRKSHRCPALALACLPISIYLSSNSSSRRFDRVGTCVYRARVQQASQTLSQELVYSIEKDKSSPSVRYRRWSGDVPGQRQQRRRVVVAEENSSAKGAVVLAAASAGGGSSAPTTAAVAVMAISSWMMWNRSLRSTRPHRSTSSWCTRCRSLAILTHVYFFLFCR